MNNLTETIKPTKAGPADVTDIAEPRASLTRWKKTKYHFRRFWICYLIGAIILAAIFLPILFIYIIPAIAQDLLNSASISIDSAQVLQPRSNSVLLNVSSHIYVPGPFTVHTDPLQLQMFVPRVGSAYPIAQLNLPANSVHKNTSMSTNGTQFTPFENYTSWESFVHDTIFLGESRLGLKGSVGTRLGKIKEFTLDMNTDVPLKGLNQFKGFTIDSAQLKLPAEPDGTNLIANATLPNQSVLAFDVGNITVDISSGELVIASGEIENLYIQPGNNTITIRGTANMSTLIHNLGDILKYQGPYIKNGYLALTTRITNIKYNGSIVPYFTEVMGNLPLTAQTPLLGLLLNTLKGLSGHGTSSTFLQEMKNKANENHGDLHTWFRELLDNSTEFELVARQHLETLAKFQ